MVDSNDGDDDGDNDSGIVAAVAMIFAIPCARVLTEQKIAASHIFSM